MRDILHQHKGDIIVYLDGKPYHCGYKISKYKIKYKQSRSFYHNETHNTAKTLTAKELNIKEDIVHFVVSNMFRAMRFFLTSYLYTVCYVMFGNAIYFGKRRGNISKEFLLKYVLHILGLRRKFTFIDYAVLKSLSYLCSHRNLKRDKNELDNNVIMYGTIKYQKIAVFAHSCELTYYGKYVKRYDDIYISKSSSKKSYTLDKDCIHTSSMTFDDVVDKYGTPVDKDKDIYGICWSCYWELAYRYARRYTRKILYDAMIEPVLDNKQYIETAEDDKVPYTITNIEKQ